MIIHKIQCSQFGRSTVFIQQMQAKQMSFQSGFNVPNVLAHLISSGSWFQLRAA